MFNCYLCGDERVYVNYYCDSCSRIKRYISIHSLNRVIEILDNVLSRTKEKQNKKIEQEIEKEIDIKEYNLRSIKSQVQQLKPIKNNKKI